MPPLPKISFLASFAKPAQEALKQLEQLYASVAPEQADVIVALGGDGFMLQVLHAAQKTATPVYGMNCGTVGFLMNKYRADDLLARLEKAERAIINPLRMKAEKGDKSTEKALAINEVSLLRQGPQVIKLRIFVDGKMRMQELACDGALVSTPAGSTAYNYSAHGPILPIGSDVLALTAMAAFRPRRWRGALLPSSAKVRIEVIEADKRPVMADADARSVRDVTAVEIAVARDIEHHLLFDPGHGLEERLIQEQFV